MFIGSLTETDVDRTGSPGTWSTVRGFSLSLFLSLSLSPGADGCRKMLNDAENTGRHPPGYFKNEEVNLAEAHDTREEEAAEAPPARYVSRLYLSDVGGRAINKHFPLICKSQ